MYVCSLNRDGEIMVHRNTQAIPEALRKIPAPDRDDRVIAVECLFTWDWLADFCVQEGIAFGLGHARYMKAIHGGKTKHDKLDSHKLAVLLREGVLPQASVDPAAMRATRDVLRRRLRSIPGVGKALALVPLYASHDLNRFPRVQEFVSYARWVKCPRESAGKRAGTGGQKIGHVHLQWAFSEAAVLFLRQNPWGETSLTTPARKHGQANALSSLAHQLGRAV